MLPKNHVNCRFCLPKIKKASRSAPIPRTATSWSVKGDDRDASAPRRLVTGRLDWRRASATRFAYGRCPRQSSQHLGEPIEGTFAIRL